MIEVGCRHEEARSGSDVHILSAAACRSFFTFGHLMMTVRYGSVGPGRFLVRLSKTPEVDTVVRKSGRTQVRGRKWEEDGRG